MNNPTDPQTTSVTTPIPSKPAEESKVRIGLVGVFAFAVCILYFCPWISILGITVSGFQITKSGGSGMIFALVPFGAVFAILADVSGNQVKAIGSIAGLIPLSLFAYYYSQTGKDLWDILQPAGYGILALSLVLTLISVGTPKKSAPITCP